MVGWGKVVGLTLKANLVLHPHACPAPPMIFVKFTGWPYFIRSLNSVFRRWKVQHAFETAWIGNWWMKLYAAPRLSIKTRHLESDLANHFVGRKVDGKPILAWNSH